jgi:hypothetical protein
MSDHVHRLPEPPETDENRVGPDSLDSPDSPDSFHTDPERLRDDVAALSELTAAGVEVDGEVQVTESTWVVYGHTSYDGEVIVGEYHDAVEASEVLRAATPAPGTDPEQAGRPAQPAQPARTEGTS